MVARIEIKKNLNDFGIPTVDEIVTPVAYTPLVDLGGQPLVQNVLYQGVEIGVLETYFEPTTDKIESARFLARLDSIDSIEVSYLHS